jgi:membrane protein
VAGVPLRWPALLSGALFTAACLSGFLQGFVLFLALPLRLGAPFGGLTVVGGVVAIGFWLFLLHVVLLVCWLLTQALDERLGSRRRERGSGELRPRAAPGGPRGAGRRACSPPG